MPILKTNFCSTVFLLSELPRYREGPQITICFLGCMSNHWLILSSQLPYSRLGQPYRYIILPSYLNRLVRNDFSRSQSSSGSNPRSCSGTVKPTKCTKHGAIQKGTSQCTVGAASFSRLLCTIFYSGKSDLSS